MPEPRKVHRRKRGVHVTLTPGTEAALREFLAARGQTLSDVVEEAITRHLAYPPPPPEPKVVPLPVPKRPRGRPRKAPAG